MYGCSRFIYLQWGLSEDEHGKCLTCSWGFGLHPKGFMSVLENILEFIFPDFKNMDGLILRIIALLEDRL